MCIWGKQEVHRFMIRLEVDFFQATNRPDCFKDADKWVTRHYAEYKGKLLYEYLYADEQALNLNTVQAPSGAESLTEDCDESLTRDTSVR